MLKRKAVDKAVLDYYSDIYCFCLSYLKNEEDAQDITQDVFLLLGEKAKELEDINIRAWLYSTAKNKIMEAYREKVVRSKHISIEENGHTIADPKSLDFLDVSDEVSDETILSAKDRLLLKLTPQERALYESIYEKKRGRREVAQELKISERALNMRILRLRRKIEKYVDLAWTVCIIILIKLR